MVMLLIATTAGTETEAMTATVAVMATEVGSAGTGEKQDVGSASCSNHGCHDNNDGGRRDEKTK